jgi:two-component system sensor histidine kinase BaeS
LVALAGAARRFAAGERAARAGVTGPGELGELARAFDAMAEEVVRAERVRRSLAADVAHELRTPLAALQAGLEELRDGLRPPDPGRLRALHDQTLRLGRVVQDLADLSAAESAAFSLRPTGVDLAEVAGAALAAQRPALAAAGLLVDADLTAPLPVRADADRLHQAVTNLLANAARYCRPGDRVSVRGQAAGRVAVLAVADTGPGIPPDELPHVFDRLWRGRGASGVVGSGIGLAVVRELVTAHGGTVTAESPAGGGTTVTVRLPLAAPMDAPPVPRGTPAGRAVDEAAGRGPGR